MLVLAMLLTSATSPPPLLSSEPPTATSLRQHEALSSSNPHQPDALSSSNHHAYLLSLVNDCKSMRQLKQLHAQSLRTAPPDHPKATLLYSKLLRFTSSTNLEYSFRLFTQIQTRNSFIWNTLIKACAHSHTRKHLAFALYHQMLVQGNVLPDKHTFPCVLKACAYLFDEIAGKQAHAHAVKLGLHSDIYINNSLIHLYSTCGDLKSARKLFDEMTDRSVVSWNAMIDGLVQMGELDSALTMFSQMQELFEPDGYTMQSVISACAGLGAVSLGMWAHAYVLKTFDSDELRVDALLNNCLIDMYCKFGMLELARQVFDRMPKHDINSWNSMILGLAAHGQAEEAIQLFDRMDMVEGCAPNSITFVGVLSACKHRGLVDTGRKYFDVMVTDYNIEPKLEHYGCLVDLLARAGLIYEALEIVSNMPMKPDVVTWRSLLDACCRKNADIELSKGVARKVLESEGGDVSSGVYVLLSRVYASASRWDDVGMIRKLMTDMGVSKEPGCSSIEMDGINHEFFAGDTTHPETADIYVVLDEIKVRLREMGYKPDLTQAHLVDEQDGEKQSALQLHSERLAIAFGLLHSKPGVPIRVFKNLRVCNDCHEVTKLISRIYNVDIIVRDRARFHHFKDGRCSCQDYW